MRKNKRIITYVALIALLLSLNACESNGVNSNNSVESKQSQVEAVFTPTSKPKPKSTPTPTKKPAKATTNTPAAGIKESSAYKYDGKIYKIVEVDGGDMSGDRLPDVAVDVGYGDRVYWALTNKYGQLIHVIAEKVVLQDDNKEPVTSAGRYYPDEANIPGTERADLDQGHVIADSLGGVSNAYNITPQDSTLNRHGDQAYMEKVIRDAGGCKDFVATITYPDTDTQIPSHYHFEYVLKGNKVIDDFDNVNPDKINASLTPIPKKATTTKPSNEKKELKRIDTNGNGKVTIAEAKAAGYKMPIYKDNWLYKYMDDRDGDGKVGE